MSNKNDKAVNFADPESIANELAAAGTEVAGKTEKVKKPAKPRTIKVTFTADRIIDQGETITFDFEVPKSEGVRGIVAGIALTDMTDDQLKIEYRNANSVFYKTKKAGNDVTKSEARLNACKAEMEKRGIQPTARGSAPVDAASIADMIKSGKINLTDLQALLDA